MRTNEPRLHLIWRLVSYTLCYFLLLAVAMPLAGDRTTPAGTLLYAALAVGGTYFLTRFYRLQLDRRPWAGMALPPLRAGAGQLLIGFGAGIALFGLVFLVEWQAGWLTITGVTFAGAGRALLAGLFLAAVPGFTEELMMRGYWFQIIGEGRPLWLPTLVIGVVFALLHFDQMGPQMLILLPSAIIVSTGLVISRLLTNSLWLAIGWHTAWDFAQWNLFGISARPWHHPLIAVKVTGPAWLVGPPNMPEEGVVGILVEMLGVALLVAYMALRKRWIDWRAILGASGVAEESFAPMANRVG